jgi:ActR/RegA family two-component response regulator
MADPSPCVPRALVVEDDAVMADSPARTLEARGQAIRKAYNAGHTILIASDFHSDDVILRRDPDLSVKPRPGFRGFCLF